MSMKTDENILMGKQFHSHIKDTYKIEHEVQNRRSLFEIDMTLKCKKKNSLERWNQGVSISMVVF